MNINTTYFCGLSTSPVFLSWLREHAVDLHDSLIEHARSSNSCRANTQKMLSILDDITRRPGGESALVEFLSSKFPHIINIDTASSSDVFEHYDPALLTIPRRLILDSEDAARQFLADKAISDHVVVDGRVYIEYLPVELVNLQSQIPAENWQIRKWRKQYQNR